MREAKRHTFTSILKRFNAARWANRPLPHGHFLGAYMKWTRLVLIGWLLSVIVLPQFSAAQAVYGNIIGTVTDPSGAAVAGAPVVVKDVDRGTTYQVTSNDSGNYEQTHLLAGRYRVSINAPG